MAGVEDHAKNYARFHLLRREDASGAGRASHMHRNKMSLAFSHRSSGTGTLVAALQRLADAGVESGRRLNRGP